MLLDRGEMMIYALASLSIRSIYAPKTIPNVIIKMKLTQKVVTVPAEFPGTSFICTSNLPKRYALLDWNPEPEVLSRERESVFPRRSILPRPSPHVMSTSRQKLPAEAARKELTNRETNNVIETLFAIFKGKEGSESI